MTSYDELLINGYFGTNENLVKLALQMRNLKSLRLHDLPSSDFSQWPVSKSV